MLTHQFDKDKDENKDKGKYRDNCTKTQFKHHAPLTISTKTTLKSLFLERLPKERKWSNYCTQSLKPIRYIFIKNNASDACWYYLPIIDRWQREGKGGQLCLLPGYIGKWQCLYNTPPPCTFIARPPPSKHVDKDQLPSLYGRWAFLIYHKKRQLNMFFCCWDAGLFKCIQNVYKILIWERLEYWRTNQFN